MITANIYCASLSTTLSWDHHNRSAFNSTGSQRKAWCLYSYSLHWPTSFSTAVRCEREGGDHISAREQTQNCGLEETERATSFRCKDWWVDNQRKRTERENLTTRDGPLTKNGLGTIQTLGYPLNAQADVILIWVFAKETIVFFWRFVVFITGIKWVHRQKTWKDDVLGGLKDAFNAATKPQRNTERIDCAVLSLVHT